MKLTVIQLETTWNDPRSVLARVEALLQDGPETDLVLLPEASLTGYVSPALDFDLRPFAEPEGGPTQRAVARLARAHHTTLVAPSILTSGAHVYNTMVAFDPDGEPTFTYAKRHPWIPETWATPGPAAPPVVRVADRKVTVAICFDLQFVDTDPQTALVEAELLLFPSAWVDENATRLPLLSAVAERFGLWIANANWAEGYVGVPGQGDSCIVDPNGQIVRRLPTGDGRLDVTF